MSAAEVKAKKKNKNMGAGKALILMFMKDFRTLYRKKSSLIFEIFLICIFVPLIWFGAYKLNGFIIDSPDKFVIDQTHPSEIAFNKSSITTKVYIRKDGNVDPNQFQNFKTKFFERCKSLQDVQSADKNPDVVITVKSFSTILNSPNFEYDLTLAKINTLPYHNEPYVIPNIFGDDDNDDNTTGIPFSKSTEAAVAQLCADSTFVSMTNNAQHNSDVKYFVQNIPAPSFSSFSTTIKLFSILFAVVFPLLLLIPTMITAAEICDEKENGIHRYMIVMGFPRFVFYLSHLIFAFIKMYLFLILGGCSLIVFLPEIGLYTFILIFLLAHIFLGIVFLFSTIFKRAVFNILSTFGYIAVLCSLHFLISKYIDIYDSSLATVLCFINPISAYVYGLEHLFIVVLFKQPLKFFTFWDYYLPFSVPIFCLLFQCIFYILLTFYFDYVLPIDDSQKRHPLFFVGKKFANEIDVEEDELPEARSKIIPPDTPSDMIESSLDEERGNFAAYFEVDTSSKSPDIEVTKLVKKWKNDEVAVKNVSFRAYRDQVTSLLGHNGAGKSTIFGILTGTIRPTAGIVRLIGEPPAAIGEDSLVGFCPQWNPLFPYLTVEEHLSFYGNIKTGDSVLPEEIDNVLNMIGLFDDRKLRGSQLSGGMKRKLCVGIAMIGESRILLLDEPTAGIDPMARRAMLQIIEKVKEGRTVLLTTHYMDEADFLSDRIIIMVKGEIVCNGSSDFLKARFATGFILSVDLNVESESSGGTTKNYSQIAADILNVVIKHCDGAKMNGPICRQINMVLPYGSQRQFPALFKELERRRNLLKIESFDVRVNSLEQVFIKVTEQADTINVGEIHTKIEEFVDKKKIQTTSRFALFASQVLGLFIRKMHYTFRHYIQFSIPFFMVSILLIVLILNATHSTSTSKNYSDFYQKTEVLDLTTYPEMKIFLGSLNGGGGFDKSLTRFVEKIPNIHLEYFESGDKKNAEMFRHISQSYFDIPPFAFGVEKKNDDNSNIIYYRHTFPNGVPLALNLLANAQFQDGRPIKTTISIAKIDKIYKIQSGDFDFYTVIVMVLLVLVFPLAFCFPAILHSLEIHYGTLHLYQRTSLSIFTYWFSAYISDFLISLVPIGIATILIFAFGVFNISCLFAYWISVLIMSVSFLSQTYVVSYAFKDGTWAIVFLFAYNLIIFLIATMIFFIMAFITNVDLEPIGRIIFPTYSLLSILLKSERICGKDISKDVGILEPFEYCEESEDGSCDPLWMDLIISFASGIFYTIILCIIAYWSYIRKLFKCIKPSPLLSIEEDSDVLEEKRKILEKGIEKFAICTKDLRKDYSDRIAVRNLSVGIKSGECFGLLGANGAGKSTTFNMLTATLKPTDGIGFVNGINIEDKPRFGYCPQKDAILMDLTVAETLMLFARLNGICEVGDVVECLMECIHLTHKRNNLAKNCSGGELRRLSLAVALVTNSDVIMMDEPTAGVDPRTRRNVWELLIALRASGTSQLLTSHSMEECEALCTRIGFINKGQLVGIGTTQYLKNRYGNSYMLSITMHGPDEPLAAKLNSEVQNEFNGKPLLINGTFPHLTWTIPRTDTPLSEMYEKLIEFVDRQPRPNTSKPAVKDFALVGTSLDEVFMAMTKSNVVDTQGTDKNA